MQLYGVMPISICVKNGRAVMMDALLVLEDHLGFDLLIGIDMIKAFGEMSISNSGMV